MAKSDKKDRKNLARTAMLVVSCGTAVSERSFGGVRAECGLQAAAEGAGPARAEGPNTPAR